MGLPKSPLLGVVSRFAGRLRFPQLFLFTAIVFLLDVFIPDLIPFVDEILLGLATLLLGAWKQRHEESADPRSGDEKDSDGPVIDV